MYVGFEGMKLREAWCIYFEIIKKRTGKAKSCVSLK